MPDSIVSVKQQSRRARRRLLLFALYGTVVLGGLLLGRHFIDLAGTSLRPDDGVALHRLFVLVIVLYVAVAALPFLPAAEIGLTLMLVLGPQASAPVYAATVFALLLAFLAGQAVPATACAAAFNLFGFTRARDLVLEVASLDLDQRLERLLACAPRRVVPLLLRHRYLTLALALNLPGNSLIGGGGGIALSAGMSGLYRTSGYLAAVAVAVAPVPLLIALSSLLR